MVVLFLLGSGKLLCGIPKNVAKQYMLDCCVMTVVSILAMKAAELDAMHVNVLKALIHYVVAVFELGVLQTRPIIQSCSTWQYCNSVS